MRAMAWVALAMGLSVGAGRAQTFLPVPLNLSNTGHAGAPAVAVGPGGDINVAWLDSGSILFRRAPDGKTFSSTMTVGASDGSSQPQIAVNSAGVYVAWAGASNISFSSMANGASTFSPAVNVSNGLGISGSAPTPRIAVDPSGGVDIVWGQNGAWFRRSPDGVNFLPAVPLTTSAMASVSPRMAINSLGVIYIVWENAGSCPTITFARSTNVGVSFTDYSVANNLNVNGVPQIGCTYDVQIAVGAQNTIHLLWANDHSNVSGIKDLITTYATDDGTSFSGTNFPETAFQNLAGPAAYTPQMAIDASGNIDVVWMGEFSLSDSRQIVYFSRSTNNGVDFSNPPLTLTSPPPSGSKPTGFPQIATEPGGAIDIIWQQASAANPGSAYDIVLARSTDGVNFPKQTLSNTPTLQGGTGQIAIDGSGNNHNSYVVWQGSSASAADILLNSDSPALTSPDFSLNVSPNPQAALPGAALAYSVTVSSVNAFNQVVTLSCANTPPGAQCSFNPASVTASASGTPSSLTLTLPATIPVGAYSVGITGTSGALTHTQSSQLAVGGLTASISPASATINAGGAGSFTVLLNATSSFFGPVTFACSGAPAVASCNFTPATATLPVNGAASTTLSVTVSAKPSTSAVQRGPGGDFGWQPRSVPTPWAITLWGIAFVMLLATFIAAQVVAAPRFAAFGRPFALILLLAAVAGGMVSCGGSTNSSSGGGGGGNPVTFTMNVQGKSSSATMNLQTISITVP